MRSLILFAIIGSSVAWSEPAKNLLGASSFEEPKVTGRTPETDEGLLPVDDVNTTWSYFGASLQTDGGRIIVGITDEIAHTGKQSIYIDFEKVTTPELRVAVLKTKLIPIKAGQGYRLSMWGRMDRKRPLSLDERRPFMVIDVDFYAADAKTKAGETIRGFQLIPGRVIPGGPHPLSYLARKWSESTSQFTSPEGAAFLLATWKWQVPTDPGESDGVIYWDDASLVEENASPSEQETPKGESEPPRAPDEPLTPGEKK